MNIYPWVTHHITFFIRKELWTLDHPNKTPPLQTLIFFKLGSEVLHCTIQNYYHWDTCTIIKKKPFVSINFFNLHSKRNINFLFHTFIFSHLFLPLPVFMLNFFLLIPNYALKINYGLHNQNFNQPNLCILN